MSIQTGQGGEMRIVLRVKDDGTAVIEKFGDTSEKNADKASAAWEKTGKALGVAAAAAITTVALMVKSAIDMADATLKVAEKIGDTTEALSVLQYTARAANVPTESLNASLLLMARNLSDAAQGTGEARFAIKDLGLDAQALANMKPSQAVAEIAQAMEGVSKQGDRVRIAMDIFGRSGADMVNVMRGGKVALAASADEAQRFGRIITDDTARASRQLKNEVQALQERLGGLSLEMAQYTTPALIKMAEAMTTFANKDHTVFVQGLSTAMKSVAHVAIGLAAAMEDIGLKIGAVSAAGVAVAKLNFAEAKNIMRLHEQDSAEINKRMLESQARLWQELPAIAEKARSDAAAGGQSGEGTRNSRQEEEDEKKLAQERAQSAKEILDIHRATLSEQTRLAEEYVQNYLALNRARAYGVIQTDQELDERRREIVEKYELDSTEKERQATEQHAAQLAARVETIRQSLQTEAELAAEKYVADWEALNEALGGKAELEAQYREMSAELAQQYENKLTDIKENAEKKRLGVQQVYDKWNWESAGFFASKMAVLMQTKSETLFKIGKAGAIAETIVNTRAAAMGAYKALASIPYVGPFLGAAAAAAAIAAGMAQVQAINSQQIGGGSGAVGTFAANPNTGLPESGGANTPAPLLSPQQQAPTTTVQINIQGNVLGNEEFVRETLIPALRAEINGRDVVFINSNSRQAQELVA
jgi:hypothetical protein